MNWPLLQNSLLVASATTVAACVLGFVAALLVAAVPQRIQRCLVILATAALALPPFLVTNAWLDLLGVNGALRAWLPLNIFSLSGAVWVLALLYWPLPFLLVVGEWRKIEAAQLEIEPAMRGLQLIRWLLWPAARGALALAAALVFVLALNNFAVPAILQVKVFPAEIWVAFNSNLDARAALMTSWPMVVAPLALLLFVRSGTTPWPRPDGGFAAAAFRRQLGDPLLVTGGVVMLVLVAFSVGAPLAQLAGTPRTWTEFLPAATAGLNALGNSAAYAGTAALLAVVLALALWRVRPAGGLWLLFFIPGTLLGVVLAFGFSSSGMTWFFRSAAVVVFSFVLRYVAIAWSASRAAMRGLDRDLIDAARVAGASRWQVFRVAVWPQIAPQVVAAGYVVYLLCLWDVETLVLIVPPGGETLALRIFNLLHYGHNAQVNALCVLLLLLALAPLVVWECLGVRRLVGAFSPRDLSRARRRQVADGESGDKSPHSKASLLAAAVVLGLAGCSQKEGARAATPIQSTLFSHVEIIGERGTGAGQFNKPRSLALDTNDNLFVVDMTGRVQKFSPEGRFLLSWQMPQTDLGKAKGMDRDREGNIVLVEPHYQRVNHFSPDGKLVAQWGVKGTNAGELCLPRAVAVDTKGRVILTEYTLVDRVQTFAPRGATPIATWGTPGLAAGEFNRAEGVGVDSSDRIFVADSCNHRIQVFSPEGTFLRTYGKAGGGRGEMSYPYDVRVDEQGRQYVCEFGNSRIQVFDANDQVIEVIGKAGGAPGEFANPWSVALDSKGNLFVADSQNHRVQKLVRRKVTSKTVISESVVAGSVTAPTGRDSTAQGKALGFQPSLGTSPERAAHEMSCWLRVGVSPLQGWQDFGLLSQGFALGWRMTAFQASGQTRRSDLTRRPQITD